MENISKYFYIVVIFAFNAWLQQLVLCDSKLTVNKLLASSFADSSQLAVIDKSGLRRACCGPCICFTVGYHSCPLTQN